MNPGRIEKEPMFTKQDHLNTGCCVGEHNNPSAHHNINNDYL